MDIPENDNRSWNGTRQRRRALDTLEKLVLAHLGVFCIAATWAYGGQAEWVRQPLTVWGSLGFLLTLAAVLKERARLLPLLWWAIPILAFDGLVLAATSNPSLREIMFEGDLLLVPFGGREGWPSSARPLLARTALWEFNAIWFACFNLVLVIRSRRALRLLLLVVCANALILAVFGTVQKLGRAPGLFFGAVPSPQKYFFSSFVYHNHWGAFMLLAIAVSVGLAWHYSGRRTARDFFHSPAFAGIVVVFFLAATIPLSGSRSSTLLGIVLLSAVGVHWIIRQIRSRHHYNESIAPPIIGLTFAILLGTSGTWFVASDMIKHRASITAVQIGQVMEKGDSDARVQLYRDTVRMALDKPWFGWGMASYPHVFMAYNTRVNPDRRPMFYKDAHSDWLQSLAEHGAVGTTLLVLCALAPLVALRKRHMSAFPTYVLGGCALIVVYAAFEFPFGSYAVVLIWWTCFFSAVTYARLSAGRTSARDQATKGMS